jgi:hypothetical protein
LRNDLHPGTNTGHAGADPHQPEIPILKGFEDPADHPIVSITNARKVTRATAEHISEQVVVKNFIPMRGFAPTTHAFVESEGGFMSMKRLFTAGTLGLSLLMGSALPAFARDRDDNCRARIQKAERNLVKAERKHGARSRQAEQRREQLGRARANCRYERHYR